MNNEGLRSSSAKRAMRAGALSVMLAFFPATAVWAQKAFVSTSPVVPSSGPGFVTLAAFTLPPTFYVGDRVELRIRLKVDGGRLLRSPAQMPSARWIHLDSIDVTDTKDYWVVHISFVSFAPGLRAFPPIALSAITLRGIHVTTASLVSEGKTRLTNPKGQLLLPGSMLILGVAIAFLIGLPLLVLFLFRRIRLGLTELFETRRLRRPWRKLTFALDALGAEKPPRNPRRFYITLVDEIRRYLTAKFESDFRSVTAKEFSSAVCAVGSEAAEGLASIVSFAELVKFAGAGADEDTLRDDLMRARAIIAIVEAEGERRARKPQETGHRGRQRS